MTNRLLKPGLAAIGAFLGLASVAGAAQDADDLERKLRELNIMDNIFMAAMEQNGGSDRDNFRRVGRSESMYLAGQGMVFSFHVLQNRPGRFQGFSVDSDWMENIEQSLARTAESLERVRISFPDLDFDFNFDFEELESAYQGTQVGRPRPPRPTRPPVFFGDSGPEYEAAHEMEEAMRDTQEAIRDMQREIRSIERELRNGDVDNRDSLQGQIDQLEVDMDTQMARLDEQQQAYEDFMTDLEDVRQEQQLARAEEASNQLVATLCDYGATLRSLPDNEHVTLILEDVVDDRDQVYVFRFSDISDCRSADTLKQNAVSYQLPGF